MCPTAYRYRLVAPVPVEEFEASLVLAILAAESLHGEATVRLDAGYYFDPAKRACVIDAGTSVGRDVNKLFVKYACREFGEDAFTVERIEGALPSNRKELIG